MVSLHQRDEVADYLSVNTLLAKRGKDRFVGGLPYLSELADRIPTVANFAGYLELLKQALHKRGALEFASKIYQEVWEVEDLDQWQDGLESGLIELRDGKRDERNRPVRSEECCRDFLLLLRDRVEGKAPTGWSTGLPSVDAHTLGVLPGQLWVISGVPGAGKTSLADQMARAVAEDSGGMALNFSLEMGRRELMERRVCSVAGVTEAQLRDPERLPWLLTDVTKAFSKLEKQDLRIVDTPGIGISDVRAQARRLALEEEAPKVIVVDYLQLMRLEGDKDQRDDQKIAHITTGLKNLARELDCAVFLLSQINRDYKKRASKRPTMADLKGSGAIEADADKVLFVYRECTVNEEAYDDGAAELIFGKQRGGGGVGSLPLTFEGRHFRFTEFNEQSPGYSS